MVVYNVNVHKDTENKISGAEIAFKEESGEVIKEITITNSDDLEAILERVQVIEIGRLNPKVFNEMLNEVSRDTLIFNGLKASSFLLKENADNIQIETYSNGIRIKKDGVYVYSACWGVINFSSLNANTKGSATATFPFSFVVAGAILTNTVYGEPNASFSSHENLTNSSVTLYGLRSSAGSLNVRYFVAGR